MTDKIETQEALSNWVKEQFQRATRHLAEQGILVDTVVIQDSRYLAPDLAIWKIKDTNKDFYWVISGDVPADALPASVAISAREAIKHFSLTWQIKAENIFQNSASEQVQKDYAVLLTSKADMLYQMQEKDEWWQEA